MSIRLTPGAAHPQAQQTSPQAQLRDVLQRAAERAANPGSRNQAAARQQMNRQERAIFTVYVVMGTLIVLFLAASATLWWLGA